MKKKSALIFIFFLVFLAFSIFLLVSVKQSYAQTCSGSYSCGLVEETCVLPNGDPCVIGDANCSCTQVCQNPAGSFSCGGGASCPDVGLFCSNGFFTGCVMSNSCSITYPPAPTTIPTSTPTPIPGACDPFGGQAGCNSWCVAQGHTGCNVGCVGCFDSGGGVPTPVPTVPETGLCGTGQFVCGSTCCNNGTSCENPSVGGSCVSTGFPPPPTCTENTNFSASEAIDNNSNQTIDYLIDTPLDGGQVTINYTDRAHYMELFGTPLRMPDPGAGTYTGIISLGYLSSAFAYNGTLSLSTPYQNFSGVNISSYTCFFGGPIISNLFVAGNGPWPITLDTNAAFFIHSPTLTFGGKVFIDINGNGIKEASEANYPDATVTLAEGNWSAVTDVSGNYIFNDIRSRSYTFTLTLPAGYSISPGSTNPLILTPVNNQNNINFGIKQSPSPACVPPSISLNPPSSTVNPGASTTLSVTSCTDVENPNDGVPPPPFTWTPDTSGTCPTAAVSVSTDTASSSTVSWTAPNCPASSLTCTPQVTVSGAGRSTSYTTNITVPATYTVTANVRSVSSVGACTSSSGNPYSGANLNTTNGSTVNTNQTTNGSGVATFTCLPSGNYQVTIALPSGYTLVGTNGGTSTSGNTISINPLSGDSAVTFCIAPTNPWFQTNTGDVRFSNLLNPIPAGKFGASDSSNPGIYYSSNSNLSLGNGSVSTKGWGINYEYSYNANTENRNGTMGYGFLKSKARQDGVTITPLVAGTFDQTPIIGSGIYESPGDLTVNAYTHTNGRRIVILVNGNVIINAANIQIPVGQGLFIVAAKGNITIAKGIGTSTLTSTTTNIDGYYTAEGSIIIDGDKCPDNVTPDLRLNVGGALIANSLKPFATTGTGTLQNKRSLCTNNLTYPSLYVASRPDFLTQLTDFYKVSYTKWQEAQP